MLYVGQRYAAARGTAYKTKAIRILLSTKDVLFLKEHYVPVYRNATAGLRSKLGPLKKIEVGAALLQCVQIPDCQRDDLWCAVQVAKTGIGAWMKFMYYTVWQEQIINATKYTILLNPYVNQIGAKLMPKVFALADTLSGFTDTDNAVRNCGPNVYPGAGWCRKDIPHAKSHEIAASAFFDLVAFGEYLGSLYQMEDAELEAFELEAQSSDDDYQAKVVLFEGVVTGFQELVHGMAALQTKAEQGNAVQFWQIMAAGSLLFALLMLALVGFLLIQLRTLRQGSPSSASAPSEVGAYTKLVNMPSDINGV